MKELYRELGLEKVYEEYEEKTHKEIKELIATVDDIPKAVGYFPFHVCLLVKFCRGHLNNCARFAC